MNHETHAIKSFVQIFPSIMAIESIYIGVPSVETNEFGKRNKKKEKKTIK